MTNQPQPQTQTSTTYEAGWRAAQYLSISNETLALLKTDHDFWAGFHNGRPSAAGISNWHVVEDPTRPGGWLRR